MLRCYWNVPAVVWMGIGTFCGAGAVVMETGLSEATVSCGLTAGSPESHPVVHIPAFRVSGSCPFTSPCSSVKWRNSNAGLSWGWPEFLGAVTTCSGSWGGGGGDRAGVIFMGLCNRILSWGKWQFNWMLRNRTMVQAFLVLSCVTTCLIYNACNHVSLCSTAVRRSQQFILGTALRSRETVYAHSLEVRKAAESRALPRTGL